MFSFWEGFLAFLSDKMRHPRSSGRIYLFLQFRWYSKNMSVKFYYIKNTLQELKCELCHNKTSVPLTTLGRPRLMSQFSFHSVWNSCPYSVRSHEYVSFILSLPLSSFHDPVSVLRRPLLTGFYLRL